MILTLSVPSATADVPVGAGGRLSGLSSVMSGAGVSGSAPMSSKMFVVTCWIRVSGSPTPDALRASPRFQWFVPVVTTSAPLAAVYLTIEVLVEPGIVLAPLFWISSPVTGVLESVLTPAGSRPLLTRASHSQPLRVDPNVVEPPGGCAERAVKR